MKRTPLKRRSSPLKKSSRHLRPRSRNALAVLEAEADRLWAYAIRRRDGHRCQRCGLVGSDAAHVYPRRFKMLRHNLNNGLILCRSCHSYADNEGRHDFVRWFHDKFPLRTAMMAGMAGIVGPSVYRSHMKQVVAKLSLWKIEGKQIVTISHSEYL